MPRRAQDTRWTHDPAGDSRASDELELRPLLGVDAVAQLFRVSRGTMYRWHWLPLARRRGPRAVRIGLQLQYRLDDLRDYIEKGMAGRLGLPTTPSRIRRICTSDPRRPCRKQLPDGAALRAVKQSRGQREDLKR
jgi:Helix-turn-helix domain